MKTPSVIDQLRIASPCQESWERMKGTDRVRSCDYCQLHVYNISELTRVEVETLIASTEGRICARLYRRADGTVLTKDCPVGLRALRKRVSQRVAAVFATMMSLSSAVFGQNPSGNPGKTTCTPQAKITRTEATASSTGKMVFGTVVDPAGSVVPGAKVTLTDADAKEVNSITANEHGQFEFDSLKPGIYSLRLEYQGFKNLEVKNLAVDKDAVIELALILEVSGEITVGIIAETEPLDTPGTTTINKRMIRTLPIN